jgi:hypothetical protein
MLFLPAKLDEYDNGEVNADETELPSMKSMAKHAISA